MKSLKYLREICVFALFVFASQAQTGRTSSVGKISVLSNNPLQFQIQTSAAVVPQTKIVSDPERLVIDIPNAVAGPGLHGMAIHGGEAKGIRVSLFSTEPPVTRIVVDLNRPQWYRIAPDASGLLVSLGADPESAGDTQPTIGWVSAKTPARSNQPGPFLVKKSLAKQNQATVTRGVSVQFTNGVLTIHANGATLSEVLFQIQKQTGAEMAIPSGTELERVAADFGPGPAGEVLGELLNGSGLNFVLVGSEADRNALRSVILSRNSGGPVEPARFVPPTYNPPTAENTEPQNPELVPPPPDENNPQPQQPPPANGPLPEAPPS
jgi:hypothetical protein